MYGGVGGVEPRGFPLSRFGDPDRRGLPNGHGAILGYYSQEEATAWIADHDSVMNVRAASGSSMSDS